MLNLTAVGHGMPRPIGVFEAVSLADLSVWQPETLVSGDITQQQSNFATKQLRAKS